MLKNLKKWAIFTLLICPDGVALLFLGIIIEVVYRLGASFGLLAYGKENFSFGFGIIAFIALLMLKLFIYVIKKRNRRGADQDE